MTVAEGRKTTLSGFNNAQSSTKGETTLEVRVGGTWLTCMFSLADLNSSFDIILSKPTIQDMKLQFFDGEFYSQEGQQFGEKVSQATEVSAVEEAPAAYDAIDVHDSDLLDEYFDETIEFDEFDLLQLPEPMCSLISAKECAEEPFEKQLPGVEESQETSENSEPKCEFNFEQVNEDLIDQLMSKNFFEISAKVGQADRAKIREILCEHLSVFAKPNEIGVIPRSIFEFTQSYTSGPPEVKSWPISTEKAQAIENEIQKLEKAGILQKFEGTTTCSNFLAISKKDGTLRIVADFRLLNSCTVAQTNRFPALSEVLSQVNGRSFYTQVDLTKAYHHIQVSTKDAEFLTTRSPLTGQLYTWARMPMGLLNSGAAFQSLLERLFFSEGNFENPELSAGTENTTCTIYIDDINVADHTVDRAIESLAKCLGILKRYNLKLNLKKTRILSDNAQMFGYQITKEGLKPLESRIKRLLQIPFPSNAKDMKRVLAAANYYRDSIPGYASYASTLYALTKQDAEWQPTDKDRETFEKFKAALGKSILLTPIVKGRRYKLYSDASVRGTGCVLRQVDDETQQEFTVSVSSSTLKGSQPLWAISSLELLGVYTAITKFETLLEGQSFEIVVDNASVYYLLSVNIAKVRISRRTPASRMLLYISTFDYKVTLSKGVALPFLLCDLLSRFQENDKLRLHLAPNSKQEVIDVNDFATDQTVAMVAPKRPSTMTEAQVDELARASLTRVDVDSLQKKIQLAQAESKEVQDIIESLAQKGVDSIYELENNLLYRKSRYGERQLFVPKHFARELLTDLHSKTHGSAKRMLRLIRNLHLFIKKVYTMVVQVCSACDKCDPARSRATLKGNFESAPMPAGPNSIWAVDLMMVGQVYIAVFVDAYSGYTRLMMLENSRAKSIKNAFFMTVADIGIPDRVVMDNASNLCEASLVNFLESLGILISRSSAYNSMGNSQAESKIRMVQNYLRIYTPGVDALKECLSLIQFKLNNEPYEKRSYSPFEYFFARSLKVRSLPDITKTVARSLTTFEKRLFDEAVTIRDARQTELEKRRSKLRGQLCKYTINVNDQVRIRTSTLTKLEKKYKRPFSEKKYKVVKVNRFNNTAVLQQCCEDQRVHPERVTRHLRFLSKIQAPKNDQIQAEESDHAPAHDIGTTSEEELCRPATTLKKAAEGSTRKKKRVKIKVDARDNGAEENKEKTIKAESEALGGNEEDGTPRHKKKALIGVNEDDNHHKLKKSPRRSKSLQSRKKKSVRRDRSEPGRSEYKGSDEDPDFEKWRRRQERYLHYDDEEQSPSSHDGDEELERTSRLRSGRRYKPL